MKKLLAQGFVWMVNKDVTHPLTDTKMTIANGEYELIPFQQPQGMFQDLTLQIYWPQKKKHLLDSILLSWFIDPYDEETRKKCVESKF